MFVVSEVGAVFILGRDEPFLTFLPEDPPCFPRASDLYSPRPVSSLLSIAFPPNYDSKAYFFVSYLSEDKLVVARFTALASQDEADYGSQQVITIYPAPECGGGQIVFSNDGTLYLNTGGLITNFTPDGTTNDLNQLSGKMIPILNENGKPLPNIVDSELWPLAAFFSPTDCSIFGGLYAEKLGRRPLRMFLYGDASGQIHGLRTEGGGWTHSLLARLAIDVDVSRFPVLGIDLETGLPHPPEIESRPFTRMALGTDETGAIYVSNYGTWIKGFQEVPGSNPQLVDLLVGGRVHRLEENAAIFNVHQSLEDGALRLEWFGHWRCVSA